MPIALAEPSEEFLRIAAEQAAVSQHYAALGAAMAFDPDAGLGGKLVFAGDLMQSPYLLRATNIAGAASLAASADAAAGRAAMRDGVIDFLVTSLDEALRILKNEIRKRQPVSVSVAVEPQEIIRHMLDRGVLPDLLPGILHENVQAFLDHGALRLAEEAPEPYLFWTVASDFSRWMPRLNACVRDAVATVPWQSRWLRLAPRYLGRSAQRVHGLALGVEARIRARQAIEALLSSAAAAGEAIPAVSIGETAL